jgi:hypothetical protein
MATWKELITTDNISDYVGGGEVATHDHIIQLDNVTISHVWNPTKRCPYINPLIAHPELQHDISASPFFQLYAMSNNGLSSEITWTKEPDAQTTYDHADDVGNGNIWSPAVDTNLNDIAISSPFSGGQNWQIRTAEISIGQTYQSNSHLNSTGLKLLWGKFDPSGGITNVPGILFDSDTTSYDDEPTYKKVILPNVGSNQYALTEWSTLGRTIWDFPGSTFNAGITNVGCAPQDDTFTLSANEKLIPFLFIKDDNYLANGHFNWNAIYDLLVAQKRLKNINITLNLTTETIL